MLTDFCYFSLMFLPSPFFFLKIRRGPGPPPIPQWQNPCIMDKVTQDRKVKVEDSSMSGRTRLGCDPGIGLHGILGEKYFELRK